MRFISAQRCPRPKQLSDLSDRRHLGRLCKVALSVLALLLVLQGHGQAELNRDEQKFLDGFRDATPKTVIFLFDISKSMTNSAGGTGGMSYLSHAREAMTALISQGLRDNDRVIFYTFDTSPHEVFKSDAYTSSEANGLIEKIPNAQNLSPKIGTIIRLAHHKALKMMEQTKPTNGYLILISDGYHDPPTKGSSNYADYLQYYVPGNLSRYPDTQACRDYERLLDSYRDKTLHLTMFGIGVTINKDGRIGEGFIEGIHPNQASPGDNVSAIIRGQGLANTSDVDIEGGGVSVEVHKRDVTDRSVPVRITIDRSASPGARNLVMTVKNGQITKPEAFQVDGPVVEMQRIEPHHAQPGNSFDAIISGKGLSQISGVEVEGGGVKIEVRKDYAKDSSVPVHITIAPDAGPGVRSLTATVNGQSCTSNAAFTIDKPPFPWWPIVLGVGGLFAAVAAWRAILVPVKVTLREGRKTTHTFSLRHGGQVHLGGIGTVDVYPIEGARETLATIRRSLGRFTLTPAKKADGGSLLINGEPVSAQGALRFGDSIRLKMPDAAGGFRNVDLQFQEGRESYEEEV